MKNNTLEALRGLFIFGIIAGHIGVEHCPIVDILAQLFGGGVGVCFFFILSGYVNALSLMKRPIGKNEYLTWLWNKIARFYPLHILMTLIFLPPLLFDLFYRESVNFEQFIHILFSNIFLYKTLMLSQNCQFSMNGASWFLSCIIFFLIISPIIVHFCNKISKKQTLMLLITAFITRLILTALAEYFKLPFYLTYTYPFFRVFDFLIGLFLALASTQHTGKQGTVVLWTLLEILCIGVLIIDLFTPNIRSCSYLISTFLVLLVYKNEKGLVSSMLKKSFFVFIGNISFAVFLLHQSFTFYGISLYIRLVSNPNFWTDLIYSIVIITLSISAAIIYEKHKTTLFLGKLITPKSRNN